MKTAKNLSKVATLKGEVRNALGQVTPRSKRQIDGYINTVSTMLRTYHNEKSVRDRYQLLLKCEKDLSTYLSLESLILQCQEVGAWGVKHKAQALRNIVRAHIKTQDLVEA
jgi:hypothetical protein